MENHYEYRVKAFGAGARKGVIHAESISPSISFSAPPEFLGEAGRWTPEHFLVAAVASCFVSTFSGIAEKSRFAFVSLELAAEATIRYENGSWHFTEIKLLPIVAIQKEEDRERAIHLLEKAHQSCLVARALQFKTLLFPTVNTEEVLAVPGRV